MVIRNRIFKKYYGLYVYILLICGGEKRAAKNKTRTEMINIDNNGTNKSICLIANYLVMRTLHHNLQTDKETYQEQA